MANQNSGRTCPKCGAFLGQKNLCPVCDRRNNAVSNVSQDSVSAEERKNLVQTLAAASSQKAKEIPVPERLRQYRKLKKSLADNPKDFAFVLRTVRTILKDYVDYFQLETINFLAEMYDAKCPFAIFALLLDPVWNPVCRGLLECVWDSEKQTATLKQSPFFWSPFLVNNKIRRNKIEEIGSSSAFFKLAFFKCNLTPPFSLSFFGTDYTDMKDGSLYQNNPAKPIKSLSLDKLETDGWQEVIPEEKRVLVLYCGYGVELKCDSQAGIERKTAAPAIPAAKPAPATKAPAKPAAKSAQSIPNAFGLYPERWKDIVTSPIVTISVDQRNNVGADDGDYRIFTAWDGLQIRRNSKPQTRDIEYSLLYLVEP